MRTIRQVFRVGMFVIAVLALAGTAAQATTTIISTTNDAEIDEHVNWANDTKGVPHPEWGHTAAELRVQKRDPNEYAGGPQSQVLIKWDVSSIPSTDVVTNVTMQLVGWDWSNGPIDVYGIQVGDWDESEVTWNNWQGRTTSLVLLGSFTQSDPPGTVTNFSDPDLTAWVQDWVDGDQPNYGVILIRQDLETPGGDSFSAHEDTYDPNVYFAPRLVIEHTSGTTGPIQLLASEDAEIDQNWIWADTPKGVADPNAGWLADELRIREYGDEGVPGEHSHALIKWDVSGVDPNFPLVYAEVQLTIWEYADGALDVYGIEEGVWSEDTVTWNSWASTSPKTLVFLGQMDNTGKAPGSTCKFTNDNLTAWVQSWLNGTQANHGLIFKWAGTPQSGDSFSARESTNPAYPGPQLILNDQPPPEPFCGDENTVYLPADLDQDCYVNWADFSVFAGEWLHCTDPSNPDCDQYY